MVIFADEDENEVFDTKENEYSSGAFDTKRHNNTKTKSLANCIINLQWLMMT